MIQRRSILCCLCALLMSWGALSASGQSVDVEKAAKVKAAYLLNFIKYTQWPGSSFESEDSPIVITVLGDCDLWSPLTDAVSHSGPVNGRRLEVRRVSYPAPDSQGRISAERWNDFDSLLRRSHVLYMCSLSSERSRDVLRRVEGRSVLTVSDMPGFAEAGGMLGLRLSENRIVFQANPKAIQKTDLTVSAKVLKLAEIVETRES